MNFKKKIIHRFFVNKKKITLNKTIIIKNKNHYLKNVLKIKTNEIIEIFNNTNFCFLGKIKKFNKKNFTVIIKKKIYLNKEPIVKIHFGQILCKKKKMDLIIQKASELGIKTFTPIINKNLKFKIKKNHLQRFKKISIASSEQSKRNKITKIYKPTTLSKWIKKIKKKYNIKNKFFCDFNENFKKKIKKNIKNNNKKIEIMLLIGSESGFSKQEIMICKKKNFFQIYLGKTILRAETAGIVAITLLKYLSNKKNIKIISKK